MSGRWWEKAKTTCGHGIHSQHKPEHYREWIEREDRRRERSTSPVRSYSPDHSLHRSSLFAPNPNVDEHVEHRHHALTKSLNELKMYQTSPPSPGHTTSQRTEMSEVLHQPLKSQYLPHMAHHHHFGWNMPTPESRIAILDSRTNFYKMGEAQNYNHAVYSKAHLITSRKA